ncbi:MAG: histidine kinase [Bacillota bacterium]|nr:histidine kinase [Bacillota bacterium]
MRNKLIEYFWRISDRFNVRMKIMGIVLLGIFLVGIFATIEITTVFNRTLTEYLQKQGISTARDVAARSTDYIYTNNLYALLEIVEDTMDNNEDVSYIMVLDVTGQPLIHSFPDGIPKGLRQLNTVEKNARYNVVLFESEEGLIQDIAVPIFEGRAGTVRLGISHQSMKETLITATKGLIVGIFIISLMGVISALIMTMVLTKPLKQILAATKEVAAGNYKVKLPILWTKDEFGQLSKDFNLMTLKLDQSHHELQRFSEEIIKHNKELASFNAIVRTVGNSLDLNKIMHCSLQQLMEILNLQSGKIYAVDKRVRQKILLGFEGKRGAALVKVVDIELEETEGAALTAMEAQVPVLYEESQHRFSYVPLIANKEVVGLLMVEGHKQEITKEKIDFLCSIGNQIGIAIQNAQLWNEVKQKDEIRAQLLQKVITAQEAERKRIARELHDETSQSLSSFLLGLKIIEGTKDLNHVRIRAGELRELVSTTLNNIHDLALELRPTILDDLGLLPAVERYCSNIASKTELEIDLQVIGRDHIILMPEVETAIYRIIQEALTNVVKYAKASSVNILIEKQDDSLIVIIEDDGIGFDVSKLQNPSLEYKHLGLFGMEERATIVGGTLTIESELEVGTTIFFKASLGEVSWRDDQSNAS